MNFNYNIIPLTVDPDQMFSCTIPINSKNITLSFRIRYNTQGDFWSLAISDISNNILIDSLPLVTGDYPAADLLAQYNYLGIGSAMILRTGNLPFDIPNATNLGTDFVLVWGDTVE